MVLGLVCRVPGGYPLVIAVQLKRADSGLTATTLLEHRPVRHATWPNTLSLIAGELRTLLRNGEFDAIVVKTIEARTPVGAPRLTDANRKRLHVEGVMLEVAHDHADIVEALTGYEIGSLRGSDKAAVEQEAGQLVGARNETIEAAVAALGALTLAELSRS